MNPPAAATAPRLVRVLSVLSVGLLLAPLLWPTHRHGALLGLGPRRLVVLVFGALVGVLTLVLAANRPPGWKARWRSLVEERGGRWADLGPLALVALQVAALSMVIRYYRIESPAFSEQVVPLVAVGFVGHHFLPRRLRLTAFLLLSLAAIVLVFGVDGAAWLLALGLGLVVLVHLPGSFGFRLALVLIASVLLGLCRAGVLPYGWPAALWPVLGSMFMFRLAAYMYDLRHQREPVVWSRTLSYFFLLPNVAFPLFPVVDFNTFKRTYYDREAIGIYQQGVEWMMRGVLHLLLYRVIYQYATLSPAEVVDTPTLVRYLLSNFGLYLRVSGQFHLIVGMLHLFGFRLPETHRFFFLASSFTDFWRRINIYWKDFMMKLVFYPVQSRLKRWGEATSVILATLGVFLVTWLTHSYQWFWLLGTWLVSATDVLFWGVLAAVLVLNAVRELRRGRIRSLGTPVMSVRTACMLALRTAGTFAALCILWSLWTAPTVRDWWAMMRVVTLRPGDFVIVVVPLAVVGALAVSVARRGGWQPPLGAPRTLALAAVPLGAVWLTDSPRLADRVSLPVRTVVRDVRTAELNRRDAAELQRGYYERIVGVNRFNGQLWEVLSKKTSTWPTLDEAGGLVHRNDILGVELKPMLGLMFHGAPFRTNIFGMRDRAYGKEKPPRTHRVAVLGASYVMGDGVGDNETFENIVEDSLNAIARAAGREMDQRYEFLNFAVSQYEALAHLTLLERGRVTAFQPDVVLQVAHRTDLYIKDRLASAVRFGRVVSDGYLQQVIRQAAVDSSMSIDEMRRRFEPFDDALVAWAYREIVVSCRAHGIIPVWAYIPSPGDKTSDAERRRLFDAAVAAGYRIIDLSDVYAGHDEASLVVASWDKHPNALGHQLIAQRLTEALRASPGVLSPDWGTASGEQPASSSSSSK